MNGNVYRLSGRVAWARLVLFLLIALPVVVLLGDLAFRLDRARFYPPLLGALVLGTFAAVLAAAVVEWGKVRNLAVGRAVGLVFTMLFFLGFFQRSLIDARTRGSPEGLRGVPVMELVTGLPNYVALRMRNFEVATTPDQRAGEHGLLVVLRWLVFAMELGALAAIGWWFGGAAATRPFLERRGVWATAQRFALPAGTAAGLLAWLDQNSALPERVGGSDRVDLALLELDPTSDEQDGFLTLVAGRGRQRRFLARRQRVPAERLAELRSYLKT